jgi:SET family sugar efflux transporter-like MFS transporter
MGSFFDRIRPLYARPSFRRLLILNVVHGLSTSFVVPFMSMFGTLEVHMSLLRFGAFMTINAVSGIVIATTLAHYSDTHFSRRTMLLLGGIAGAVGYIGYAYLRSFVPLLLVGSIVLGVSSITFSQLFAYARELLGQTDIAPAEGAFYINVFRMFIALSWTVGPAIAAWIMVRFSFRSLFLCASADLFVFTGIVWFGVPAAPARARSPGLALRPSFFHLLRRSDIAAHFAAFVLITASVTIGMMNLPLLILHTLRGTEANVGTAYSVAPVFELPFMLYFGWLATRFPPARIIRVGMGISLAYYTALTLVTAPWHVYLCQGLSAAATSVIAGVAITYFQGHMPRYPGSATNLYANAQRMGSTAGYFLFVALAWRFGYRAVFEACAAFAALALGLMLVPVQPGAEEEEKEAPRRTPRTPRSGRAGGSRESSAAARHRLRGSSSATRCRVECDCARHLVPTAKWGTFQRDVRRGPPRTPNLAPHTRRRRADKARSPSSRAARSRNRSMR